MTRENDDRSTIQMMYYKMKKLYFWICRYTDRKIKAKALSVVVRDHRNFSFLVDVSIPTHVKLFLKETETLGKYKYLDKEVARKWN